MIPADPAKRRQAAWMTLIMAALGCTGLLLVQAQLAQINAALDIGDNAEAIWLARRLGILVLTGMLAGTLGLALVIENLVRRSLREGRFPPEGVSMLSPTRLRTGAQLRQTALLLRIVAILLILLAGGVSAWSGLLLYGLQ
ncbi:MAG: hypothetical protein KDI71_04255 [Xanthomonadales bacterium]|nr:hypothetical protein [Xanthomonadales bacterium]